MTCGVLESAVVRRRPALAQTSASAGRDTPSGRAARPTKLDDEHRLADGGPFRYPERDLPSQDSQRREVVTREESGCSRRSGREATREQERPK